MDEKSVFPFMVPTSWWLRDIKDPEARLKRMKWLDGVAMKIHRGETKIPGISVSKKGKSWIWVIWGPEGKKLKKAPRSRIEKEMES